MGDLKDYGHAQIQQRPSGCARTVRLACVELDVSVTRDVSTLSPTGLSPRTSGTTACDPRRVVYTSGVPFHVVIWPASSREQANRELYAFDLDESTLRERFIRPYEQGEPITWNGRALDGGDIQYLRVSETAAPVDEQEVLKGYREYEVWESGANVTNNWISGPPGTAPASGDAAVATPEMLDKVVHLCRRFDAVARQLTRRRESRPTIAIDDEYDVQDLMHALLLVEFDDVRAESWNPSYLGSSSRIDFLIPAAGIIVEVKKTRDKLGDREIGNQLAEDVTRYSDPSANRGADQLVCFIYDPGRLLANPRGLESDLDATSNERLQVVGVVG